MTSPSLIPDTAMATAIVTARTDGGHDEPVEQQQDPAAGLDDSRRDHPHPGVGEAEALEGVELPAEGHELGQAADHEGDPEDLSQSDDFRASTRPTASRMRRAGMRPDLAALSTAA